MKNCILFVFALYLCNATADDAIPQSLEVPKKNTLRVIFALVAAEGVMTDGPVIGTGLEVDYSRDLNHNFGLGGGIASGMGPNRVSNWYVKGYFVLINSVGFKSDLGVSLGLLGYWGTQEFAERSLGIGIHWGADIIIWKSFGLTVASDFVPKGISLGFLSIGLGLKFSF